MDYLKPQSPIMKGSTGIYPLTTYDQIIMKDGTRFNGNDVDAYSKEEADNKFASIEQGKKADSSIQSINNIKPSSNGNYALTSSMIGALSNSYTQIDTLTTPTQLPKQHISLVHVNNCGSSINDNVSDGKTFSDYSVGDFYCLYLGSSNLQFGTLIITTPRFAGYFWVAQIWSYNFVRFTKIS